MPVVVDPRGEPDARWLTDDRGRVLAGFAEHERDGAAWADDLELADGVGAEEVAYVARRDLAGRVVSAPVALGRLLVLAGGRPRRRGHVMRRHLDLAMLPRAWERAEAGDVRLEPVTRGPADIAPAMLAAYHPGHPDVEPGDEELATNVARVARVLSGEEAGPLLGCSRLAVAPAGRVAAAALVVAAPEGPWLVELFRDPAHPGLGTRVLGHSLWHAAADGHPSVGLAVTEGNAARALYERAGFAIESDFLNVELPA